VKIDGYLEGYFEIYREKETVDKKGKKSWNI
jgi:hypothetical protein